MIIPEHEDPPPGHHWACTIPEGGPDFKTAWMRGCEACFIAFEAAAHRGQVFAAVDAPDKVSMVFEKHLQPDKRSDLKKWFMREPGWELIGCD